MFCRKYITEAFSSVLHYGDVICRLSPLSLHWTRFITPPTDSLLVNCYSTHHCILYENVWRAPLTVRRDSRWLMFLFKASKGDMSPDTSSLLNWSQSHYSTRSSDCTTLGVPRVNPANFFSVSVLHKLGTFYNVHLNLIQLYIVIYTSLRLWYQTSQHLNVTSFNYMLSCMVVCHLSLMHLSFICVLSQLFTGSFLSFSSIFIFCFIGILSCCFLSIFIFLLSDHHIFCFGFVCLLSWRQCKWGLTLDDFFGKCKRRLNEWILIDSTRPVCFLNMNLKTYKSTRLVFWFCLTDI